MRTGGSAKQRHWPRVMQLVPKMEAQAPRASQHRCLGDTHFPSRDPGQEQSIPLDTDRRSPFAREDPGPLVECLGDKGHFFIIISRPQYAGSEDSRARSLGWCGRGQHWELVPDMQFYSLICSSSVHSCATKSSQDMEAA